MPFSRNTDVIWADGPGSTPTEPHKPDIRVVMKEIEGIIDLFLSTGGAIYPSLAALNADLSKPAFAMAWVMGDPIPANNGVYGKVGGSGSGSWARRGNLPFSFIIAFDAGAGTPNAIEAISSIPVSGSALIWLNIFETKCSSRICSALIWLNIFETNTSSPVTVRFNGNGPAYTIKTNSGNDPVAGGLVGGMIVLGITSGSTFRLVSDQASSAIVTAAEEVLEETRDVRDVAVAAAATAQAITGITELATQPDLLANTTMTYTAGQPGTVMTGFSAFVRSNGSAYKVAAAAASDHHITTAGGVKLYEAGPYTSRARAAQGVLNGYAAAGEVVIVAGKRYSVNAVGPDGLVALDMDWSGQAERLMARMASGYNAVIAGFGPSTTDGTGTTGRTMPNPVDGQGKAIGTSDHNLDAPNAWPATAQVVIREMYGNQNIKFINCGYDGRSIVPVSGRSWVLDNFEAALLNGPAGKPDMVVIEFGLNDPMQASYTDDVFLTNYLRVLSLCDYYNIIPCVMTPDPVSQNTLRQGGAFQNVIGIIRSVADRVKCRIIDNHDMFLRLFSRPTTNSRWAFHQSDGLHFSNKPHSIKGAYAAACLFAKTLFIEGEDVVAEAPWSKYCNTQGLTYSVFSDVNNRFGGSLNVKENTYSPGQALIQMWVWNDSAARDIYWHSVDGDGYYRTRPFANAPTIEITDYLEKATGSIPSPTAGFFLLGNSRRQGEVPQRIQSLPSGLVKVAFKAPTDNSSNVVYLGYFSFRKAFTPISAVQFVNSTGTGIVTFDRDQYEGANVLPCFGNNRGMQMAFEVNLFNGTGVFLWASRVFGGTNQDLTNDRRGLLLYRNDSAGTVALYDVTMKNDGTGAIVTNLGSGAFTSWASPTPFMIRAVVDGTGAQILQLYAGWTSGSPLITVTRAAGGEALPWGGHIGGFFKNYGESGAAAGGLATIEIVDLINV